MPNETENPVNQTNNQTNLLDSSAYLDYLATKDAIDKVPIYDGKNYRFRDFDTEIKSLLQGLPAGAENRIINGILGRLRGRARTHLEGKGFVNVKELLKSLREKFAPDHDYEYYRNRLFNARMRNDEDVSDFYSRLQRYVRQAVSEVEELDGADAANSTERRLESEALDVYIDGLPDGIRSYVHSRDPTTLKVAWELALKEEKRSRARFRRKNNRDETESRYKPNDSSSEEEFRSYSRERGYSPRRRVYMTNSDKNPEKFLCRACRECACRPQMRESRGRNYSNSRDRNYRRDDSFDRRTPERKNLRFRDPTPPSKEQGEEKNHLNEKAGRPTDASATTSPKSRQSPAAKYQS